MHAEAQNVGLVGNPPSVMLAIRMLTWGTRRVQICVFLYLFSHCPPPFSLFSKIVSPDILLFLAHTVDMTHTLHLLGSTVIINILIQQPAQKKPQKPVPRLPAIL